MFTNRNGTPIAPSTLTHTFQELIAESYIRDRHAEAINARGDSEGELVAAIDEGEAIAAQVRAVAEARAVAGWWDRVITQIDQGGTDPFDALWRLRAAARRTLLDHPMPRIACPFGWGFAAASIEGARHFYRETAGHGRAERAPGLAGSGC